MNGDMARVGGNDILELWSIVKNDQPHLMWHDRKATDSRAKMVLEMLKAWGVSHMMADAIHDAQDSPHERKKQPVADMVLLACEMVDAAYCEMEHRGWVIPVPSLDECGNRAADE